MPPQKTNAKKNVPAKAVPAKQKKVVAKEVSDDDEDDDEDIDEDEIDEDASFGSVDEDEELDGEEGSDDLDEEEDDEEDDDEEDEEVGQKPAKRAKLNGKEETPAKSPKKEDSTKASAKTKKEDAKKAKQDADAESKKATQEKLEDRASAVGQLTEGEKAMFEANFRAMSATSVFVGKLPDDTTDEDLKKLHPSIRTIRRPTSRKGLPATFGFLNFADKETADRALKEIKKKGVVKIRGQEVVVSENGNGKCHPPSTVDRRKLRIYGCPKFVTAETIKKSLPGCIDVLLGDKDKGNSIEAVAVFKTSAETKKILLSQQTLTLNECVCALFYLNISHNVKQHERKKDKKQQKKQKEDAEAAAESDDQDESDLPDDKIIKFKKENVKPQVQSAKKNKKRPAPEDSDDEDDGGEEEAEEKVTLKNKKVSLKSPQKTPVQNTKAAKKTPRKGTPFKKTKTAA